MKNSSSESKTPNWLSRLLSDSLNLPDDPEFVSESPKLTWAQFIELSERQLPYILSQSDFIQKKLERKFDEPFKF